MCGIAGIINSSSAKEVVLDKMLSIQNHRGPDHTGKWVSDTIALGHNRLSILDLSKEGNQPFVSACGNYILVFNGEIYNYIELKLKLKDYSFKTTTDTEVLLAAYIAWGKDCLRYLNGMFSFSIWDVKNKKMFAARDRFGVKPFYYHLNQESFCFASEIKTLHEAGIKKKYNESVWASYFAYGSYGMPDETFWENISQLPGGHFLEIENLEVKITKWYFFEKEIEKHKQKESFQKVKLRYKELLKDSIRLRFRADVEVGFNISGGLDSSALLAFVNETEGKEQINGYTFYTGDKKYDELPWVEEMISLTENPLKKVLFTNKNNSLTSALNYISKIQDEPYGGIPTLAYSQIFKQARQDNVLVLLDGQGMDEQWAGYDYYTKNNDITIQGVTSSPFRKNVLSSNFLSKATKPVYPTPFDDIILNKQYRDLFYTKIPRALRFNDRVSMAYSTELREPFLDYRLVEYAFSQPLSYKINKGVQKYLLREIVAEFLSATITYAPKRPLQTPQREWLGDELSTIVEENIVKIEKSEIAHWFNFEKLNKEWRIYLDGDQDSSFHIWQWLNLGLIIEEE